MQKDEGLAAAMLDVVQPDAVHLDEFAGGWVVALSFFRQAMVDRSRDGERCGADKCPDRIRPGRDPSQEARPSPGLRGKPSLRDACA
jgi:hypothetical protein